MNPGSGMIGFLIVVGLVMQYGWIAAAIIGIPLLLDLLFGWVLLPLLKSAFSVGGRRQQFRSLPELEKALRRGSQGFAVCVLSALGIIVPHVWLHGWRDFAGMLARPEEFWPLIACAALFMVGAVRFVAGTAAAGARDLERWFWAAVRLGCSVAAMVWMVRADLLSRFAAWPGSVYVCAAVFAPLLWVALVAFMRVLLLSWPRGLAEGLTGRFIEERSFSWEQRRRRWWQFWKRNNR
jgi:hypothetical protein